MMEPPLEPRDAYSPHLRTALVLAGTGTAGAYQAGVLRAFHEAGVKVDVVAGRGMGAASELFDAVDGAALLWEDRGIWKGHAVRRLYRWRPALRASGWAVVGALAVVIAPVALLAAGLLVYPLAFLLGVIGVESGSGLVRAYAGVLARSFEPGFLPDVLPRALVLSLTALVAVVAVIGAGVLVSARRSRRHRTAQWWRVIGAPFESSAAVRLIVSGLWRLLGGGGGRLASPVEFSRAYTEMLGDNLGQPAFHELMIVVHDVDLRRDLVFALMSDRYRRDFFRRRPGAGADRRASELFDLSGVGRDHLFDALAAALCLPVATEAHSVQFAPEGHWRGEAHRLVDRPGATARLLDELAVAGVEQIIVVSAVSEVDGPHGLATERGDPRGRIGEYLAGTEAAGVRDAVAAAMGAFKCVFHIRPVHNPLGPLDFEGCHDERSDRTLTLAELVNRGYEDAYRAFIDPIVGAGGERIEAAGVRPPVVRPS
ncbi:MAG: hypothetical protein IMZ67_02670 [Acidobacteria bacterium]|nr:hypothetical protein [Acidobacteriota bacterium]